MAKFILILILFSFINTKSYAQFFGIGGDKNETKSKLQGIIQKLKSLEITIEAQSEENLNNLVKNLEITIDQDKLYCSGEVMDEGGKYITKDKKEICMRELKQRYVEAIEVVFELKKKYLRLVFDQHMSKLSEIEKQSLKSIDSKF